jgi:hypothetical protein
VLAIMHVRPLNRRERLRPDLSAYQESELYTVPGLEMKNGEPARLFSSRNPDTMCRVCSFTRTMIRVR